MAYPGFLPAVASRVPTHDAAAWARRLIELYPRPWSSDAARDAGGKLYSMFKSGAAGLVNNQDYLAYVEAGTRIKTATGDSLDMISRDLFGDSLPRYSYENDDTYRARIYANLFLGAVTKPDMRHSLENFTGNPVTILEPWAPGDCAVIDQSYFDVDIDSRHGRWGDPALAYQGMVEIGLLPPTQQRPSSVWTIDKGLSFDVPASILDEPFNRISLPSKSMQVDALINNIKPCGTTVWRKYRNLPTVNVQSGTIITTGAGYSNVYVNVEYPYVVFLQPVNNYIYWVVNNVFADRFQLYAGAAGEVNWIAYSYRDRSIFNTIPASGATHLGFRPPGRCMVNAGWGAVAYLSDTDVLYNSPANAFQRLFVALFDDSEVTILYPDIVDGNPVGVYSATIADSAHKKVLATPYWNTYNRPSFVRINDDNGPTDSFQIHTSSTPPSPTSSVRVILCE